MAKADKRTKTGEQGHAPETVLGLLQRSIRQYRPSTDTLRGETGMIPILGEGMEAYLIRSNVVENKKSRQLLANALTQTSHLTPPDIVWIGPKMSQPLLVVDPAARTCLRQSFGKATEGAFEIVPRHEGITLEDFCHNSVDAEYRDAIKGDENRRLLMRHLLDHPGQLMQLFREAAFVGSQPHASWHADRHAQNIMVAPDLSLTHIDSVPTEACNLYTGNTKNNKAVNNAVNYLDSLQTGLFFALHFCRNRTVCGRQGVGNGL